MNKTVSAQPKSSKKWIWILPILLAPILIALEYFVVSEYFCPKEMESVAEVETEEEKIPKGTMILIEYKDTVGLVNFVNEMYKRDIPGLLLASPDFIEENCEDIKQILKHNVEIIGSNPSGVFWDMPYEEQYDAVKDMKNTIETCTGQPLRIVGSRYMASDENTVKAAEALGIPYVIGRGTTDTKATVYKPEEYDVKILSVSNIPVVTFKYGSLCDYSFYERSGTPDDMLAELKRAVEPLSDKEKTRYGEYQRVTPVSHTSIGGYLKPWMNMWIEFWDTNENIDWVGLDDFMENADWEIPMWQVPINKNAPYTPEKIRPLTPYEEVEKVDNPCAVLDLPEVEATEDSTNLTENVIHVFHNGIGAMCLDALEFFEMLDYPVVEHLTTDDNFSVELAEFKSDFTASEGVSTTFGYYPMIFIRGRAFSGFNEEIQTDIENLIQ